MAFSPVAVDTEIKEAAVLINEEGDEEDQHFSYAMQLVGISSLPMVLLCVFRLGLFEIIAGAGPGGKLSASHIVANLSTKNPEAVLMVDRMLHFLACHFVLTCSIVEAEGINCNPGSSRAYGLAPVAKYFLRNPDLGGASLGSLLNFVQDKVSHASWLELQNVVLEGGIPFNRAHGTSIFEYLGKDSKCNQAFNEAMMDHTTIAISRILCSSYKGFQNLETLVDVGGGLGINISKITAKYPTIKGINFDLPHIVQHAPTYSGVQHIGGDMFESVPEGDAIFMKWVLHNWDDDHCIKLLKNCFTSLPDKGKVIVADAILPLNPSTNASVKEISQGNMFMMTQTPGGKERSEHEFLALAIAAGFKGFRKECFVCNLWIMEFYK